MECFDSCVNFLFVFSRKFGWVMASRWKVSEMEILLLGLISASYATADFVLKDKEKSIFLPSVSIAYFLLQGIELILRLTKLLIHVVMLSWGKKKNWLIKNFGWYVNVFRSLSASRWNLFFQRWDFLVMRTFEIYIKLLCAFSLMGTCEKVRGEMWNASSSVLNGKGIGVRLDGNLTW